MDFYDSRYAWGGRAPPKRLTPSIRAPIRKFDPNRSARPPTRLPTRPRTKRFENIFLVTEIAVLLVLVSGFPAWDPLSWAAPSVPSPLATGSFAFGTAGDFGFSGDAQAVMTAMGHSGLDFVIPLGDFSYGDTSESNWCNFFESHVGDGRVILITGNHDDGESSGGDINVYRQHCGFGIDAAMVGDYGKAYYFDYPRAGSLARFVLTRCGGPGYNCNVGGAEYNRVATAIDNARGAGIPWVIVGMHENCITTGVKSCEIGEAFQDLLFSKRVDLILQGHDHNYQRSHQLTCADDGTFRSECVADTDDSYGRGNGAVLNIVGTGGRPTYPTGGGPEEPYFTSWSSSTKGFLRVEVSADALNVAYRNVVGSYSDGYVISGGGSPPRPPPPSPQAEPQTVLPTVETSPSHHSGDTADDVAIWIHPTGPALSLVIGDDKDGGLMVWDLAGQELQYIEGSRYNNLDIRYNFPLVGTYGDGVPHTRVALLGVSDEGGSQFDFFKVNPATRRLEPVGSTAIPISPYGGCMYVSASTGKYYFIAPDQSGVTVQVELRDGGNGQVAGTLVRQFDVGGITEGCVADDVLGHLYMGEEAVGIWKYGAEPGAGSGRTQVDRTGSGGNLVADVEGLSIYYTSANSGYLLASSQGESRVVVYTREGSNAMRGRFGVGSNGGIDSVSGNDGLDVTNFPLGGGFAEGLFVIHDGSNSGASASNVKYVRWGSIADALGLVVDTTWDPRRVGSGTSPPPPAPTQCSDGIDNDGDGSIDLSDPGCANAQDNVETNAPPLPPPPSDGIATEVTMQAESPDPSGPGEIVTMGATLVRADTRAPIPGVYVRIQGTDDGGTSWWDAGYYVTDGNGRTTGGVVFLFAGENQGLRATFEGDSTYAASVSSIEPHSTHNSPAPPSPPPEPSPRIPTIVVIEPESPDPSAPGDMVALSGVLRRADTGAPIPNQFIHMEGRDFEGQNWWHAGYYWTDANGRAVGGTRFMFAHETQRLRASFDGDPTYAPSVSALEPHVTRGVSPQGGASVGSSGGPTDSVPADTTVVAIVALVAPTVALHVFRRRRSRSP